MRKQKDTFTIETVSEDLREQSAAADDSFSEVRKASVTFRKVFKGFDEVEVLQFIEDQEEAFKSASSIYERTLEDSKSENTLLRRENKALKQNIAELEDKIKELKEGKAEEVQNQPDESGFTAVPLFQAQSEGVPTAIVSESPAIDNEAVERLEAEIAQYVAKVDELQAQLASLEGENETLKIELEQAKLTVAELQAEKSALEQLKEEEKEEDIEEEEEAAVNFDSEQINQAQATIAELNEKLADLQAQLDAKTVECEKAIQDYESFKRDAGDGAIMADTYIKQAEKLTAELAELRTINQKQAYEYAEKLSAIETETSADRAKVSQQMKMHTYHLRQIDTLISQLSEQFELAREAVEEI